MNGMAEPDDQDFEFMPTDEPVDEEVDGRGPEEDAVHPEVPEEPQELFLVEDETFDADDLGAEDADELELVAEDAGGSDGEEEALETAPADEDTETSDGAPEDVSHTLHRHYGIDE